MPDEKRPDVSEVLRRIVDQPPPPRPRTVIEADEFALKDTKGNVRVRLTMDVDTPVMAFYGNEGGTRAVLTVSEDAVALALSDPKGVLRTGIIVTERTPMIFMLDKEGKQIWHAPS